MARTLLGCPSCHDDHVLFDLLAGAIRRVRAGEIIAFHSPPGWADQVGTTLVSRVLATGGETIKGDHAGHVMISVRGPQGPFRILHEPYVYIDAGQDNTLRSFGPITVPNGRLWVMGDHRNDSGDSRYHCGPGGLDSLNDANCDARASTVAIHAVIGIAVKIISPANRVRLLR